MAQVQLTEWEIFNRELIQLMRMKEIVRDLRDDDEVPEREPRIRRMVFVELPRELVLEYAKHHKIPHAHSLPSKEIYKLIQSTTDNEVRALEHHVQYPTKTGAVVARTHEEMITWLEEHDSLDLDPINWSEDEDNEDYVNLELYYNNEIQPPPSPPLPPNPSLIAMKSLLNQYIGTEYTNRLVDFASSLSDTIETESRKDIKTQLFDLSMKLLAGYAGTEVANLVAGAASSFGRAYLAMGSSGTSSSLKRPRSDEDEDEDDKEEGTSSSRQLKRARRCSDDDDGSLNAPREVLCKWSDYICDDSDAESDSSYSPSICTSSDGEDEDEDAHLTQIEAWEAREYELGRIKNDQGYISGDLTDCESESESAAGESEPEVDSDSDEDPDYVPPHWTFEDVWEIVSEPTDGSKASYYAKLHVHHINELLESGYMSDAGLSDDDSSSSESSGSNPGLHDTSTIWRTYSRSDIPDHLKDYTSLPSYLRLNKRNPHEPMIDLRKVQNNQSSSSEGFFKTEAKRIRRRAIARRAASGSGWERQRRGGLGLKAALDVVLADSESREYAFDDREWRAFEDLTNRYPSERAAH